MSLQEQLVGHAWVFVAMPMIAWLNQCSGCLQEIGQALQLALSSRIGYQQIRAHS